VFERVKSYPASQVSKFETWGTRRIAF